MMLPHESSLGQLRQHIDELDERLLDLLNERASVAMAIGQLKRQDKLALRDRPRERELLSRLFGHNRGPLSDDGVDEVFSSIMGRCRELQRAWVAFLGPPGSFSHQAALSVFGDDVKQRPLASPREVVSAVADPNNEVTHALVPIDNAVCGTIDEVARLIREHPVTISSRHEIAVELCCVGAAKPQRIYSKREVFAQCQRWLQRCHPQAARIETASTSAAVELVANDSDEHSAAIGSALCARMHGLPVIQTGIADIAHNRTQFVVIVPKDSPRSDHQS